MNVTPILFMTMLLFTANAYSDHRVLNVEQFCEKLRMISELSARLQVEGYNKKETVKKMNSYILRYPDFAHGYFIDVSNDRKTFAKEFANVTVESSYQSASEMFPNDSMPLEVSFIFQGICVQGIR